MERGWCRVEMMMAAAYPVADAEQRSGLFRAHLQVALGEGRRPHAIYGDREMSNVNAPPEFLLPLSRKVFEMYRPVEGSVTDDRDREIIERLSFNVYQMWPVVGGERWVSWLSQGGIRRGGLFIEGYPYMGGQGAGRGKVLYHEGAATYEGEFVDGERHGYGIYSDGSGSVYEGEYSRNKKHGQGKEVYSTGKTYQGTWCDGQKDGFGKEVFDGGGEYEGGWKKNTLHGHGRRVFKDGSVYEGEYENGKMHGVGRRVFQDGSVYEGEYENGKMHGQGKYVEPDGTICKGKWKCGDVNGPATEWWPNGSKYEGEYVGGAPHGKGSYTSVDGVYRGEFETGCTRGLGSYTCSGMAEVGRWEAPGNEEAGGGQEKQFYADAESLKGELVDGVRWIDSDGDGREKDQGAIAWRVQRVQRGSKPEEISLGEAAAFVEEYGLVCPLAQSIPPSNSSSGFEVGWDERDR